MRISTFDDSCFLRVAKKSEGVTSAEIKDGIGENVVVYMDLTMEREAVISKLRAHEAQLRAAGITHVRVHGSVARADASANSDVDLIADFDQSRRLSLLDMVGLENMLADILGRRVDLSPAGMLREPVREKADREGLFVF